MALKLMFITNNPDIARIAEKNGVDRVFIDLETKGKAERQKNMNTVKSNHSISDIKMISEILETSELMVRINAWNEESPAEVEQVIAAGAQRIMLPMWKTAAEVDAFLKSVNRRVGTILLLETKAAAECLDEVLENPLLDEIHIGLNDLHLSYKLTFMFETLSNGMVESLCKKIAAKGIPYGFGGIARLGEGLLPAENILMEHVRLKSSIVILSRSFCDITADMPLDEIDSLFKENIKRIRDYEIFAEQCDSEVLLKNKEEVVRKVAAIVAKKGS